MIPGNGRPDSECMDLLTDRQYGLEVGAPPFVLYMPECRHNWGESLKSSKVQNAHGHNAQWAPAGGVQNWHCSGQVTAEESEHHWRCDSMCPEKQKLIHNGTAQQKPCAEAE